MRLTCQHCGKNFSAWDDLVGKSVKCPKCQQSMIVPGTADGGLSAGVAGGNPPTSTPTQRPAAGRPAPQNPSRPATRQPIAPKPPTPPSKAPEAPTNKRPANTRPAAAGPAAKPPAVAPAIPQPPSSSFPRSAGKGTSDESDDFDDREDLPFGCPKCNAEMEPDDDLCNVCGYHLILKKVIDMDGIHRPDRSTGFDRVVKKHLDDSESTTDMLLWAKLGGIFFVALICFVCLGAWGLLIGVFLVIGYFIYQARLRVKAEDNLEAQIETDPLAAITWSGMLTLQRLVGWRSLEPPFAPLRVLTLRDGAFGNDELAQVEDLDQYEVLDLEGTGITDAGLGRLKAQKQLRFLVVKNAAVTAVGVQRLQQSIPTAWIWH